MHHRYVLKQNLLFLVGICLCVYFGYHLAQGERSYTRLLSLNSDIELLQEQHEELKNKKDLLTTKVVMLRPNSIEEDLLEQRVREVLGFHKQDELAVIIQ